MFSYQLMQLTSKVAATASAANSFKLLWAPLVPALMSHFYKLLHSPLIKNLFGEIKESLIFKAIKKADSQLFITAVLYCIDE